MRIRILDQLVSNQIAAGEVIERPASVVKELLENSLDAGSTKIDIDIVGGGIKKISITDNGHGIIKDDLPIALLRHATSKITTSDDLHEIMTLGFRGEALASIVSVSAFEITSKTFHDEYAYKVSVTGFDRELKIMPAVHQVGTTVEVRDLFCTLPVRRKFLRGEKTEFLYIADVVKRMVLSNFNCTFTLRHNGKIILQLPIADTENKMLLRVAKIYGKNFAENCYIVNATALGLTLTGWFAKNSFIRRSADLQYFFVNKRSVKDKVINHALKSGYSNYIANGNFSVFSLYLDLNLALVDVNVHPTKHEVRFEEPRLVHNFISSSINKLFSSEVIVSNAEHVAVSLFPTRNIIAYNCINANQHDAKYNEKDIITSSKEQNSAVATNALDVVMVDYKTISYHENDKNVDVNAVKILSVLCGKFILVEYAKEQFLFSLAKVSQSLIKYFLTYEITSKELLFAHSIMISSEISWLESKMYFFDKFGFNVRISGVKSVIVTHVPEFLLWSTLDKLINSIIDKLCMVQDDISDEELVETFSLIISRYIIDDFLFGFPKSKQEQYLFMLLRDPVNNKTYIKFNEYTLIQLFV